MKDRGVFQQALPVRPCPGSAISRGFQQNNHAQGLTALTMSHVRLKFPADLSVKTRPNEISLIKNRPDRLTLGNECRWSIILSLIERGLPEK